MKSELNRFWDGSLTLQISNTVQYKTQISFVTVSNNSGVPYITKYHIVEFDV